MGGVAGVSAEERLPDGSRLSARKAELRRYLQERIEAFERTCGVLVTEVDTFHPTSMEGREAGNVIVSVEVEII